MSNEYCVCWIYIYVYGLVSRSGIFYFCLGRTSSLKSQSNSPWHVALSATKELSGGIFWMIGTKVMPGRRFNLLTLCNELQSRSEWRKTQPQIDKVLPNWICFNQTLQALIMIASWSRLHCVDEHDVVSHVRILIEYCCHLHGSRKTLNTLENNQQQGKTTSCRHIRDIPISHYLANFYKLLICGSQDFDHSAFWIRAKQHHKK